MTDSDTNHDPLGVNGTTIADKFAIERFVAEGGFSLLYKAQHKGWGQPVAVKFLKVFASAPPSQRQALLDSFTQEGKLLRELSSRTASILQAHDVGQWSNTSGEWYPYLILEWLDGKPLDAILDDMRAAGQPPLSFDEILRCIEPAAKALDVVHRKQIAHRDIKPANIFVIGGDPRSPDAFVKVLDFGIAKVMSDMAEMEASKAKTGTGISSFTPWYGAPEQFSKRYGATGPWTDVFAMALVMVEMMTLRSPLDGDDIIQLSVQSTSTTERPTPRSRGVEVSDEIEAVFARALAVKPTERYGTMGLFWNDLCKAVGATQFMDAGTQSAPLSQLIGEQRATFAPAGPLSSRTTSAIVEANTLNANQAAQIEIAVPPVGRTDPTPSGSPSGSKLGLILGGAMAAALLGGGAFFLSSSKTPPASSAISSLGAQAVSAAPAISSAPPADACPPGMVKIPGGDFYMGFDSKEAMEFEKPQHQVTLAAFCIDVTEVTVEAYRACSDAGKCPRAATTVNWPDITPKEVKAYGPLCNIDDPGRDKHPINCVDWEMASNYCKKNDKRLPTSAEWEFAVRGPDGRIYPWGDEPPDANHLNACGKECLEWGKKNGVLAELTAMHNEDDGYPTTAPVGSFPKGRSRYGLDDVIGNVMEWVHDWNGPYDKAPKTNPTGPEKGTERVIRGGAWNAGNKVWTRPSFRFQYSPDARSHGIGFRCAR